MQNEKLNFKSEESAFPPTFWTPISDNDKIILLAQNKGRNFTMSQVVAVAKRCSQGFPQVVVCRPFSAGGLPFPTIFWLTCPYLNKKCGTLESNQKVSELEEIFRSKPLEIDNWHKSYQVLRKKLIDKRTEDFIETFSCKLLNQIFIKGVGGIDLKEVPFGVKCLHLQIATWLGMGKHPAEHWLSTQIGSIECQENLCNTNLL